MQHSYRTKGWAKRLGAMAMTLVMLFGLMAAGLPQAQAVTQDDINNLKSQAASLSSQKADIQKKLDKLSNSKNSALNEKLLLEQKINVLRSEIAVSEQAIAEYGEMITQKESELAAAKEKEAKYYRHSASACGAWKSGATCPTGQLSSTPAAFRTCWTR